MQQIQLARILLDPTQRIKDSILVPEDKEE
jgi:hypothetical protein